MLRHLPFAKLNDGLTPFNNLITIFNVFVWQVSTSILYWFTNNVLGIFVTDWWWYARDLDALSPEILGIGPALFFYILESFLWPSGLILFDRPSHCLLNLFCFPNLQLMLLSQVYWACSVTLQYCHSYRSSPPKVILEEMFWKYAANLQENTHPEVRFQ